MENRKDFWKNYWDSQAEKPLSDYEIDRGVSSDMEAAKQASEDMTIGFVEHKATDVVFDAGCGTGVNLSRLGPGVRSLVGMDYSPGMIMRARQRLANENVGNAGLLVGSISHIPTKPGFFDKIVCISVLHYLNDEDCERALREFARISRNGALLVLHVKNLTSLYLSTLLLAKKFKQLLGKRANIEYYRPRKWYERKLSELNMTLLDYHSDNILIVEFLPRSLARALGRFERKYLKNRFFMKYGSDLILKVKIK
ncbi:MAG: class I SAM-dependent methyltransferase [bacterium]|nr:MAG: class I SAM-dependent methyltransferase [bacterium]